MCWRSSDPPLRGTGRRPAGSRGGFTLLEVLIAVTLLSLMVSAVVTTGGSMDRAYGTADAVAEGEQRVHTAMERVEEILARADASSITPAVVAPFSSTWIEFQPVTGYADGSLQWGSTERLELEPNPADPDNGLDDDGNGIVDDCRLVWTRDVGGPGERRTVLCTQVAEFLEGETFDAVDENGNGLTDERGFCVEGDGGVRVVRLTIEIPGPGGMRVRRTVERTLAPRVGE